MNSKGFTLIELLAVIIIMAIIALIATPQVMKIINDTRVNANKETARALERVTKVNVVNSKITEGTIIDLNSPDSYIEQKLNGKLRYIANEIEYYFYKDNKCYLKGINDKEVLVINKEENECNFDAITGEKATFSGFSALLQNATKQEIDDYKIYGDSSQDTYLLNIQPFTYNPIYNLGYNGKIEVYAFGKNLFKDSNVILSDKINKNINTDYIFYNMLRNNIFNLSFALSANELSTGTHDKVGVGFSVLKNSLTSNIGTWYNLEAQNISFPFKRIIGPNANFTNNFYKNENITPITLYNGLTIGNSTISNIQVEANANEVSNTGQFETYKEPITTIINMNNKEPLKCIDELCDYIDYQNSRIVRRVGMINLNSSMTWYFRENDNPYYVSIYINKSYVNNIDADNNNKKIITTHIPYGSSNLFYPQRTTEGITGYVDPSAMFIITAKKSRFPHTLSWANYLDNENNNDRKVNLYYSLQNDIYEDIELPKILTQDGNTTLGVMNEKSIGKITGTYTKKP